MTSRDRFDLRSDVRSESVERSLITLYSDHRFRQCADGVTSTSNATTEEVKIFVMYSIK